MQQYDKPFHEYTDRELIEAYENPESNCEQIGTEGEIILRFYNRHVKQ